MVGKPPHRAEGKAPADEVRPAEPYGSGVRSEKEDYDRDLRRIAEGGGPSTVPAEESVGGSRPGVPSRIRAAFERRLRRARR